MGRRAKKGILWVGLALLACIAVGCAQKVGDIDRTQPNRVLKTDLEGVWYMMETVTDVPATSSASLEGETGKTEKIVWQVEENYLIAYRSYPLVPGAENVDQNLEPGQAEEGLPGSPIAAYPVLSHFDVIRGYDSATGEESNVIYEDTSDRPWYERDYMRVDWSRNDVVNFDFISGFLASPVLGSFQIDAERNEPRSIYFERDSADTLVYFDTPRRMLMEPDFWGCLYAWYGWGDEDCTSSEIEVVTSFAKTPAIRDYEPLPYDDLHLTRFGYFRSERYSFDPQRGVRESGRIKMLNRHNIWLESYVKDASGEMARDDQGKLIPIPMNERQVRTVPYYLNATFPTDDALMVAAAQDTMHQWDLAGREVIAAVRNVPVSEITTPVFVLCNNPVAEGDPDGCGERGMNIRFGDLRYSTLHWVEADQLQGPLGYGPSALDPETGETLSGRAYMYAGSLNYYASSAVDMIRFFNDDLKSDDLIFGAHYREDLLNRLNRSETVTKASPKLKDVPLKLTSKLRNTERSKLDKRRDHKRRGLRDFDSEAVKARLERAREAGLSNMVGGGDEYAKAVQARRLNTQPSGTASDTRVDPTTWLSPTHMQETRRRRQRAIARGLDYPEMLDVNITGIATAYKGRTDYEQMWLEIRAAVFKSTALHEVGHTVGLRHNLQGSYDSLNYFDAYWELRKETMKPIESVFDLYESSSTTNGQIVGQMREHQYSSIMDYSLQFNLDLQGLGRYDKAALMYGYSGGSTSANSGAVPGFVQVFAKPLGDLGDAGQILTTRDELGFSFDDPTTPIVPYLERWHYTTFMQAFPAFEDAFDREWMRLDEFHASRETGGPSQRVRVPYLFCSDEWVGALLSCNYYDAGADPFELTRTVAAQYRDYYYFVNFRRDRLAWWDAFSAFNYYFYNVFLPLSDYFQNWYLAPEGADNVMDDYYWMAVNMGFNIIAETMATPPYGTYCTGTDDQLVHLSDEAGQGREQTSEYFLSAYCKPNAPFFEIEPGVGRRRFSTYDVESGYFFADKTQEAGHYWATLAAFWALIDPEAFVLGSDGDAGTFAISYYDIFDDEINTLVNSIMTENYTEYSPRLQINNVNENNLTGLIHYQRPRGIWDPDRGLFFDPETGEELTNGPSQAETGLCEPCDSGAQCNGYTGFLGGVFCQALDDGDDAFCLQDCSNDTSLCPDGTTCDSAGNCAPDSETCTAADCSPENPLGACPTAGQSCFQGVCQAPWTVVETDATFSIVDDMLFYGMLYTTSNYSTRYNDQINVFKLGTGELIEPGPGFEIMQFTDPISGDAYGAVSEVCDEGPELVGGSTGMCSPCEEDEQCAGFNGFLSSEETPGTYCWYLEAEDDPVYYCLIDCTDTDVHCPAGTVCSAASDSCVPEEEMMCSDVASPCSAENPQGDCADGTTCYEGTCLAPQEVSSRCTHGLSNNTGGAQMILKGQVLVERYNTTLDAYWSDDGSDPVRENQLYTEFSRVQFELQSHIEKINAIRAVFSIFGKVY